MAQPGSPIRVDYLARVEGEGGLTIRFGGPAGPRSVKSVELRIFEPPRLFEALLRGRSQMEAPDITSRICGICPVAYQMSAVHAIEDAHSVRVEGSLRALRRLLYCGEWIESHALHVFMLHAPDFAGYGDALSMAREHGDLVRRGLRMKRAGNAIVERLGGRAIHPVNVRVGGFHRAPARSELEGLLDELRWAREAARATVAWAATLEYPALEVDHECVSLVHPDEYPMNEGRLQSSRGLDIPVQSWPRHFVEEQVAHSNALHARIVDRGQGPIGHDGAGGGGGGAYLCGPLARINLNFERLCEPAREAASAAGFSVPCRNPFKSLLVRTIEMVHAFDEAVRIIEGYRPPPRSFIDVPATPGTGAAITEAPRGSLFHRYRIGDGGLIAAATIVPPTSQNQRQIEEDLRALAPSLYDLPHEKATLLAEQAVRSYDPCISCATHFLRLRIERE